MSDAAAVAGADLAVQTSSLTKDYGDGRGVFDLDLQVRRGEVFGYLGPNGAGKSTTIRMLLDMVRPTSGTATVLGQDPRTAGAVLRQRISYVPGELALWKGWTARTIIDFLGGLRGGFDRSRVEELAERLRLDLDRVVGDLSKGNKQKVGLVTALAAQADLLILDEPTSGLDPLLQVEFQALVREAADGGATVLLSSHVLNEVQQVAGRVGIIRRGRLVAVLGIDDLIARASQTLEITFAHDAPTTWPDLDGVDLVVADGQVGRYTVTGSMDAFVKSLSEHTVLGLRGHDADLEEIFLQYYSEDVAGQADEGSVVGRRTRGST